jgi:hypothetical protein
MRRDIGSRYDRTYDTRLAPSRTAEDNLTRVREETILMAKYEVVKLKVM